MCHPQVVFSKAKGRRYSNLCLNPDTFTGLKEPEHQEKYISLPAKTGFSLKNKAIECVHGGHVGGLKQ